MSEEKKCEEIENQVKRIKDEDLKTLISKCLDKNIEMTVE